MNSCIWVKVLWDFRNFRTPQIQSNNYRIPFRSWSKFLRKNSYNYTMYYYAFQASYMQAITVSKKAVCACACIWINVYDYQIAQLMQFARAWCMQTFNWIFDDHSIQTRNAFRFFSCHWFSVNFTLIVCSERKTLFEISVFDLLTSSEWATTNKKNHAEKLERKEEETEIEVDEKFHLHSKVFVLLY